MATKTTSWTQRFLSDLQPIPGRLPSTLRIVLATVITLILLQVWQMPFAYLGLYLIFLVGRDSPSVSLRSGVFTLLTAAVAIAISLAVVVVSDNDPVARLLSVTVIAFISGLLLLATTVPALASALGFLYCTVIALWEFNAPADTLVKTSLKLLATCAVGIGSAIAVEYIFGLRNPTEILHEQRRLRYQAVETLFRLYGQGATAEELAEPRLRVIRLAAAGQVAMQELYNMIVDRNLNTGDLPVAARVRITMLAQLLDIAASFAALYETVSDPAMRRQCLKIADQSHSLAPGFETPTPPEFELQGAPTLLDRVEYVLHTILAMPHSMAPDKKQLLVGLASKELPILVPGALKNRDNIAFALKISLCATLCYVFYHAVDWQGISTSVVTVFVAGLSTTGAIKQKFIFRLLGSAIGGTLGIGATALLFPHMDTITSLVMLVAAIVFVSAWTAGGRYFNYVGLQVALSFYLIAFEGFSAPTELAPARDRLIGILVALVVMWFVFDRIWPVRTITAMRRSFASILRDEVVLLRLSDTIQDQREMLRQSDILRDQLGKRMANLRTMGEAVEYEFGTDREAQLHTSELIVRAAFIAVTLFWNQIAMLHLEEDKDFLSDPHLIALRRSLADRIEILAKSATDRTEFALATANELLDPFLLANLHYKEYAHNSVTSYMEIQSSVLQLGSSA